MKEHKLSKGGKYASSIMLSLYFSLNDWRGEREKKKRPSSWLTQALNSKQQCLYQSECIARAAGTSRGHS